MEPVRTFVSSLIRDTITAIQESQSFNDETCSCAIVRATSIASRVSGVFYCVLAISLALNPPVSCGMLLLAGGFAIAGHDMIQFGVNLSRLLHATRSPIQGVGDFMGRVSSLFTSVWNEIHDGIPAPFQNTIIIGEIYRGCVVT